MGSSSGSTTAVVVPPPEEADAAGSVIVVDAVPSPYSSSLAFLSSSPPVSSSAPASSSRWGRFYSGLRQHLHLSKHALGVFLILCVTVIWVASSTWIQYIFGELEFNKPYFLTYFNTTGFCLWNAGFLVSSAWRRIPYDSETAPQPIFVDDAALSLEGEQPLEAPQSSENSNDRGEATSALALSHLHRHRRSRTSTSRRAKDVVVVDVADDTSIPERRGTPSQGRMGGGGEGNGVLRAPPPLREDAGAEELARRAMYDECCDYSSDTSSEVSEQYVDVPVVHAAPPAPASSVFFGYGSVERSKAVAASPPVATGPTVTDAEGNILERIRIERARPYTLKQIWYCAMLFCPLWFLANFLFNLSLSRTSVASNTILSSTSSIWALAMSYVLLKQPVGPLRVIAVGLSVGGSIMIGLSDHASEAHSNAVTGDIAALVSAFFYAAYTSVLKWCLPDDARYPMGAVFGAVGVINFVLLWPGLSFLHLTGWESFQFPTAGQLWPLMLNALIGTNLSDVLWARSVVLTSPLVATLGLSLTSPLAMIVDYVLYRKGFSGLYVGGAALIVTGFILCNISFRIGSFFLS